MYNKIECISISCDNCGGDFMSEHDGFSIFNDEINANNAIDSDGNWHIDEGKHYCPECHTINDNDELVIDMTRTKPLDWAETNPTPKPVSEEGCINNFGETKKFP